MANYIRNGRRHGKEAGMATIKIEHERDEKVRQMMDEEYSRGLNGCLWSVLIIIVAGIAGAIGLFT